MGKKARTINGVEKYIWVNGKKMVNRAYRILKGMEKRNKRVVNR